MQRLYTLLAIFLLVPTSYARGTGDLGIVIERGSGTLQVIETTGNTSLGSIDGLGDLSHASAVYSRDGRYAYIFGRDGVRLGQVLLLPLANGGGQLGIVEENVVFVVEIETAAVHVGGADECNFAIQRQ